MSTDKNTLFQKCRKFNGGQTQTYMGDRERERDRQREEREREQKDSVERVSL